MACDPAVVQKLRLEDLLALRRDARHLLVDLDDAIERRRAADAGPRPEPERLLTVPEAAQRLGLTAEKLYELARRGRVRSVRIGKYVRIKSSDLSDLESFLTAPARPARPVQTTKAAKGA